jgi:hypothetical protein
MDPRQLAWALSPPKADMSDPFAVAAARVKNSARPDGGRQEGLLTTLPEKMATDLYTLPARAGQAAVQYGETGEYNPAPIMESALTVMTGGMPMAQAGALGTSGGKAGIRAYHGSPHDFDRFDMSKIGTGEGAQAYGHGLYFAENEGVARSYRDTLAPNGKLQTSSGSVIDYNALTDPTEKMAASALLRDSQPHNARFIASNWMLPDGVTRQGVMDAIERLAAQGAKPPGRMYEVNINARPDQFLDWDKPLPQQPLWDRLPGNMRDRAMAIGEDKRLGWGDLGAGQKPDDFATGQALYRASDDPVATSTAFREAGIPGIRYLDQGSRGAGQGSSNYVVFDDKLIDILKKYGLTGMLGGGGMAAGVPIQDPQ